MPEKTCRKIKICHSTKLIVHFRKQEKFFRILQSERDNSFLLCAAMN